MCVIWTLVLGMTPLLWTSEPINRPKRSQGHQRPESEMKGLRIQKPMPIVTVPPKPIVPLTVLAPFYPRHTVGCASPISNAITVCDISSAAWPLLSRPPSESLESRLGAPFEPQQGRRASMRTLVGVISVAFLPEDNCISIKLL
ncbi:hypothetical protein EDB87DRAFT_87077 [Lactarius vividus]|nr:hypothetical protein EDB87DRAFT_87077 [Lactarius vividus]